ncbi:DNA-binding response regulator [Niastella vici]|uniref:DNA-binding response regulator n=1 Tax=Niastella vici TaxID=1703345 RepID=A0A1V9G0T3_9BACT|nr:LytTR family DNA-binding domain-containing protein [Niastella vici]OQP64180.1 DNA-binding response regulator [Niastella vici]
MPDKKIICLAVDDEPPALDVLKKYIASVQSLELANTCVDAVETINFLQQHPVDLMFLDIKMPELLGTDLVRTLKNPPKVIFTTAYRKYALEGFELDAVDYLLKPISFDRFLKAVNKVMQTSLHTNIPIITENAPKKEAGDSSIYFRSDRKMMKVHLEDILYIESLKDYIKVVTIAQTIITKQSISAMEENLPKEKFIRIHRSFIISLNKVESYTHDLIWIGKTELPVSRMYRHALEQVLKQYR